MIVCGPGCLVSVDSSRDGQKARGKLVSAPAAAGDAWLRHATPQPPKRVCLTFTPGAATSSGATTVAPRRYQALLGLADKWSFGPGDPAAQRSSVLGRWLLALVGGLDPVSTPMAVLFLDRVARLDHVDRPSFLASAAKVSSSISHQRSAQHPSSGFQVPAAFRLLRWRESPDTVALDRTKVEATIERYLDSFEAGGVRSSGLDIALAYPQGWTLLGPLAAS